MKLPFRQRGFLLIVAVVLIVVAATMATVIATLSAGGARAGGEHVASTQALYAAETGLERATYQRNTAAWNCSTPASYSDTLGTGGAAAGYEVTCYRRNPTSTTLPAGITAAATVIPLTNNPTASPYIYAPFGQVKIDNENIFYTAIGSAAQCAAAGYTYCLVGAERGAANTLAVAHSSGRAVQQDLYVATSEGWNVGLGRAAGPKRTLSAVLVATNLLPTSSNSNFNAPSDYCDYTVTCMPTGWSIIPGSSDYWPFDKAQPPPPEGSASQPKRGGPDGSRAAYVLKSSSGNVEISSAGSFNFSPAIVVTAPTTLVATFDYTVERIGNANTAQEMGLTFRLVDSAGTIYSAAEFTSPASVAPSPWLSGSVNIAITGTGQKSLNQLKFDFRLKAGQTKQALLDNIFLSGVGGNPKYELRAWREVFP